MKIVTLTVVITTVMTLAYLLIFLTARDAFSKILMASLMPALVATVMICLVYIVVKKYRNSALHVLSTEDQGQGQDGERTNIEEHNNQEILLNVYDLDDVPAYEASKLQLKTWESTVTSGVNEPEITR